MHLKKDYHYLVIFIFFTITSFLIANQVGFDRHWSSNFDHEFTLTYNALLFNGGLYHEYLDHPGFFSILFLSLLFQFLSFFDLIDVYKISLLSSENFDTAFQEIIIITRIYSTICVSLFASICYFFFSL